MLKWAYKYPVVTLLLTSVLLYFFNLVELPLSIMEARNFNVAREMMTEGNWLLTTMNGVPRYEKPPFPAWFTTLFAQFDINSIYLYRLPNSIAATIGILFSYYLFKVLTYNKKIALIGALVLSTSFYYIFIRLEAPSDTFTHAFMIGGLFFLVKAMQSSSRIILYWLLSSLCIAISVLSKGPVSPYALFLPFAISYILRYSTSKKTILSILGVLVLGLSLGASWYIYVRLADPQVLQDIASEETSNWTSYNVRPFYYYWSFFVQSGIWTIPALLSLAYPYFKTRVSQPKLYKMSWLWTIATLVLLSVIPEKKSRYLVPILIPLAFNVAQILDYQFKAIALDRVSKIAMKFHYLIIAFIGIAVLAIPFLFSAEGTTFWVWYAVFSSLMLGVSLVVIKNYKPMNLKALFITNIVLIVIITTVGKSGIQFFKQNENYKASSQNQTNKIPLFYYKSIQPEIIWGSKRISSPFKLNELDAMENKIKVIVTDEYAEEFKKQIRANFTIISEETYDRNYFGQPGDDNYRTRKLTQIYTLKKNSSK